LSSSNFAGEPQPYICKFKSGPRSIVSPAPVHHCRLGRPLASLGECSLAGVSGVLGVAVRVATFVASLAIGISTALEELHRYGKRWQLYRESAEDMLSAGWDFAMKLDRHGTCTTQKSAKETGQQAFDEFAAAVNKVQKAFRDKVHA
jgi:hypothetical protein